MEEFIDSGLLVELIEDLFDEPPAQHGSCKKRRRKHRCTPRVLVPVPSVKKVDKWRHGCAHREWVALERKAGQEYDETQYYQQQFRQKFRLPHALFRDLYKRMSDHPAFRDKPRHAGFRGHERYPLMLWLMGILRKLGTGVDYSILSDILGPRRKFWERRFEAFVEWGSTVLYEEEVRFPNDAEVKRAMGTCAE